MVTEVRARHEGATYGSDVFLIADGVLPAQVQEIAEVTTTRVEPEVYVPPWPGAFAYRATGEERAKALYFDQMERKVAAGMGRDGDPIYLNLEFLDGTRGGHVSISGISRGRHQDQLRALPAVLDLPPVARSRTVVNAKALVFSVKGEDLLFLDHANRRLDEDLRADYATLGLRPRRSRRSGSSPRRPRTTSRGRPHVVGRTSGVSAFWWTLAEFCSGELLPYVFADAEDERNQYTMVIHQVAARLRREAVATGQDGAVTVEGRLLRTYDDLIEFLSERLTDEDARRDWAGPVTGTGTVNAFLRRLRSSLKPLRSIVRGDLPSAGRRVVTTEGQQVTVIDLHNLPERAQRFVVGVVLAAETARKEAAGAGGLLFTMLDELNKYAPREGGSPIKEVLLDIAERGRSLGIILIGAQQTASEVERRIVSNSSIKVVGRLDPAEAGRPEYGFLPPSQRARAVLAKPGTMFVSQPEIPVPLAVEFPFPAWATRESEMGAAPVVAGARNGVARDPFARLPAVDDEIPF